MSPVFAHGQLRLYLLALLDEEPRHGYDVIRALADRFGGMYTPSAGTVYPRLAQLESDGLVRRADTGRRAIYELTDTGRAEVGRRRAELDALQSDLDASVADLAREVRQQVRGSTRSLKMELAAAARTARRNAEAVPAADGHWASSPLARDIEQAASALRGEARAVARRRGVDARTLAAVRDALETARRAVHDADSG